MSLRKKTIHGAKWSMLQEIAGQLIDFFSVMILARLLGPKDFGVVAIAAVIIIAMRPFISQGLGVAITQKSVIENEHLDSVFWSSLICGCLIALAIATGAGWLAIVFSEPELSDVLPWFSISIVLSSLTTVQEANLRRELNFKIYAIRATTGKLIGGIVGVTMAFYDFGVWSLVARFLVTSFVSVFLLWGLSSWRPGFSFSRKHFSELFPFGIKVLMNELMVFVNRQSDNLLISYFLGSTALGYYNVAYRLLVLILQLVSATIGQVSMPVFARLQNDKTRLKKAFCDITQLIALIAFPVFLGMQVLVPEIVTTLLGEQWGQSTPVLQILLFIGIVQCLASPMISIFVGAGKPGIRLKLQVIDAIVNLIGFFIAVQWGIVWVAASYVIVGYALTPLWYWAVKTVIPLHWTTYVKLVLRPLIIAVVMIGGIVCAKETIWTDVLGINIIGDIIYLALSVIGGILIYVSMTYWLYPSALNKVLDIVKTVFARQKSSSI
jgi:O-antigen/teichoic acid export membrane protein